MYVLWFIIDHVVELGAALIALGVVSAILFFCFTVGSHARWYAGLIAITATVVGVEVLLGFGNI